MKLETFLLSCKCKKSIMIFHHIFLSHCLLICVVPIISSIKKLKLNEVYSLINASMLDITKWKIGRLVSNFHSTVSLSYNTHIGSYLVSHMSCIVWQHTIQRQFNETLIKPISVSLKSLECVSYVVRLKLYESLISCSPSKKYF